MKLNINAVNFEIASKLEEFIQKKTQRFHKLLKEEEEMEVNMTVVKPATNLNKCTKIQVAGLFAEKTADSFEEGVLHCLEAIERQLEKKKDK